MKAQGRAAQEASERIARPLRGRHKTWLLASDKAPSGKGYRSIPDGRVLGAMKWFPATRIVPAHCDVAKMLSGTRVITCCNSHWRYGLLAEVTESLGVIASGRIAYISSIYILLFNGILDKARCSFHWSSDSTTFPQWTVAG